MHVSTSQKGVVDVSASFDLDARLAHSGMGAKCPGCALSLGLFESRIPLASTGPSSASWIHAQPLDSAQFFFALAPCESVAQVVVGK